MRSLVSPEVRLIHSNKVTVNVRGSALGGSRYPKDLVKDLVNSRSDSTISSAVLITTFFLRMSEYAHFAFGFKYMSPRHSEFSR